MEDQRAALARLLDGYAPVGAAEIADVARLRSLLDGDLWTREAPVHVTGSALVVDPAARRVLLRWHPRMRAWMQVGGHFDPGEDDPFAVALREAAEETGLSDLRAVGHTHRRPLQIVIVPVPARGDEPAHEHADIRYLLGTDRPDAIRAESPEAELRWSTFDEATRDVTEDNLRTCLVRARDALR